MVSTSIRRNMQSNTLKESKKTKRHLKRILQAVVAARIHQKTVSKKDGHMTATNLLSLFCVNKKRKIKGGEI